MKQYIGLDIGGTTVKIGLLSENGSISHKDEYEVSFDGYETPIIKTVIKSLNDFLQTYDIEICTLSGIGVSATGQIDSVEGKVIGVGGNIRNWNGTNIKRILESEYHLPVSVMNDANCMILAEHWKGKAKGMKHAIGITIGTGVGGGIVCNGSILTGYSGVAGEIGHMIIDQNGRTCTCGNTGCYEQYASMSALIKDVEASIDKKDLQYSKEMNGRLIFEELAKGNEVIHKIVVTLCHIFNPEIVVIGGGVSHQEKLFLEPLRDEVMERLMGNFSTSLIVESSVFGNDAGMVGAVAYLEEMLHEYFG